MAVKFDFKMDGLKELDEALGQFTKATGKNVLGRALKNAAEPVRKAAVAKAPRASGALQESIQTRIRRNLRNKNMVLAVIGPVVGEYRQLATPVAYSDKGIRKGKMRTYAIGSTPGVYGMFTEFGTIDTPAQPFMRPAWEQERDNARDMIADELRKEIDKAAARAERKAARLAAKKG